MFTAALFIIAPNWNQSRYRTTGGRVNNEGIMQQQPEMNCQATHGHGELYMRATRWEKPIWRLKWSYLDDILRMTTTEMRRGISSGGGGDSSLDEGLGAF